MNSQIFDIHADDYGLSENSDKDILNLCKSGKLNSLSIIPNLEIFSKSSEQFNSEKKTFPHEIKVSIHLNFMEGKCCSEKNLLPDLVDKSGLFNVTWGKLFLWNFIPFIKNRIKRQLKVEISAQIKKCISSGLSSPNSLRIDSHQHPHMIPIVFDSIIEVLNQENFHAEFIRNTQDPINFYLPHTGIKNISLANIIKCIILNYFSIHTKRILKKYQLPVNYLCGVFFSGKMDDRIKNILPVFEHKSLKKEYTTEVLFHPGLVLQQELTYEFTKKGFNDFHLSQNRKIEYNEVSAL